MDRDEWQKLIECIYSNISDFDYSIHHLPEELEYIKKRLHYHKIHKSFTIGKKNLSENHYFVVFTNPHESFYIQYKSFPHKRTIIGFFKVLYTKSHLIVVELLKRRGSFNQRPWMFYTSTSSCGLVFGLLTYQKDSISFKYAEDPLFHINGKKIFVKRFPIFTVFSDEYEKSVDLSLFRGNLLDRFKLVRSNTEGMALACKSCNEAVPFQKAFSHFCKVSRRTSIQWLS